MKKELLKAAFRPLTWINRWIPKDKKLVFFYSNLGFRDNVRGMYDYLIAHGYQDTCRIVCAINEADKYQQLKKEAPQAYRNVRFVSCRRGIWYFLRCGVGFYCFGKYPIKPAKNQTIINLWHGAPLKRIGNMEPALKDIDYNFFTYVLATSEFYAGIMMQVFRCGREQILVEGQPRNDALFSALTAEQRGIKDSCHKIIAWLPTYRNEKPLQDEKKDCWPVPLLAYEEAEQLNERLAAAGCRLIIKLHPLQYHEKLPAFSHIEVLDQQEMEKRYGNLYQMLKLADALITDYSSIYFDYMLLDRPIGFTVDDMELYAKERGFVFEDPQAYMPGEKITSADELSLFIRHVIDGADPYAEQRRRVNDIVNTYKDGNSSERIAKRYLSDL